MNEYNVHGYRLTTISGAPLTTGAANDDSNTIDVTIEVTNVEEVPVPSHPGHNG